MPHPGCILLDLIEKRLEGLVQPSYFSYHMRINVLKNSKIIQKCRLPRPITRECSMKINGDNFIIAPFRAPKLLLFKNKYYGYQMETEETIPTKNDSAHYSPKYMDFKSHAFTVTTCDKVLHYGDVETFKIIDHISHPEAITQHCISSLCPFNTIAAGNKGHVFISDFRTGLVVMSFSGFKLQSSSIYSSHAVSWSPFSDRIICSLVTSDFHSNSLPLRIFDLRKTKTDIGPVLNCQFGKMDNDHVDFVVPFVDFLKTGSGSLVCSIVNDSHLRVWDIITGKLKQTIYRHVGNTKIDYAQPATLDSDLESLIFVPDIKGVKVSSSSEFYYYLEALDNIDFNLLGYSAKSDSLVALSNSNSYFFVYECGKRPSN